MLENLLSVAYYCYFRPVVKWFLFKLTRLHELQRICYGAPEGAARTSKVEKSLELSRTKDIRLIVTSLNQLNLSTYDEEFVRTQIVEAMVALILRVKRIKPKVHPDFPRLFGNSVKQIYGYRRLYHIVEDLRMTSYDYEDPEHEGKLLELWALLMPNAPLDGRISKQWQDIGFQGDDPKTDFRGMGILGLENLIYFAREYNTTASHVLMHSLHPQYGYTFAIVGINLTSMAWNLLKSGMAKTHIYNVTKKFPTIDTFHELYCYLFYEFDKYWMHCKPRSIMDFPYIQENFEANMLRLLEDDATVFKLNLAVENV